MLGTLKKRGADLTLKVKDLFTSSESQIYVKDLRKVMTYKNGRRCQYPKNYDEIVKRGRIRKDKNSNVYRLFYGEEDRDGRQSNFELTKITEVNGKSYFTISFLVSKDRREVNDYRGFYEPFKFSKIDLEKYIPVFEIDPALLKLTNSSVLTKEVKNEKGKVQEVVDEKGRNGELLYTSDYKKLRTLFSEIRDQNGNLELDKSLISVPIVFVTGLAKICAKLLTFIPMKLGESLIGRQNPIAKSFGYLFFTPAMVVKNLVNIGATTLRAPILLFVANEKKYGDAYFTMWKHQLKGCWEEAKGDFSIVQGGERLKQKDHEPLNMVGTWKELDAMKPDIERKLKEGAGESSEHIIDKSQEPGIGENLKKNLQKEVIVGLKNHKSSETYVEREQNRKNSQHHMPPFN